MYLFCLLRFIQMNEDLEQSSIQSRSRHSSSNLYYSGRSRSDVNRLSSSNPVWMIHRLWALPEDLKWHAAKFLIQQISRQTCVAINWWRFEIEEIDHADFTDDDDRTNEKQVIQSTPEKYFQWEITERIRHSTRLIFFQRFSHRF